MHRLALGCALALLCLLAPSTASAATYYVHVNGIAFYTYDATNNLLASPTGDPTVDPGDTILWEWGNSGSHDVVSGNLNNGTPDGKFNNGALVCCGATYSYTTGLASSSYTYFCTPHRASGMKGTIKATGTANEPPVAQLTTNPAQPRPGQTVTLDASASSDPEAGLLARYRWDLDGNGTYETSTTTPTTTTSFAQGNHVVRVRVIDNKSALGVKAITVTAQFPPPAATTGGADVSGSSAATLKGSVNPNGTGATWHFEYGPTTAYGSSTPDVDAGAGSAETAVSAAVSGLPAATTIHYRLVASNSGGTTPGADATLVTGPAPTPQPPASQPADDTPPVVSPSVAAVQSVARGVLGLTVTPREAVTLRLSGRIPIRGKKTIVLRAVSAAGTAGRAAALKLRIGRTARAAIRAALARGVRVQATLVLEARDAAGNVSKTTKRVRLKR